MEANNAQNLDRTLRTPASLVLLIIINYIFKEFFQLIGLIEIAGDFTSLLTLLVSALGMWTYSRFSGNLLEARGWIEEAVAFIWTNFIPPNNRRLGALGGVFERLGQ